MFVRKHVQLGLLLAVVAGVVLLAGCGDGRPKRVPVSGQVLIDGEPVKDAVVQVIPSDSRAANGRTDADGRFKLTTFDPDDGCVTGTHKVVIVAIENIGPNKQLLHVPRKYTDIASTDLTLTVDGPTEDAKIELTWDGKKGPIELNMEGE